MIFPGVAGEEETPGDGVCGTRTELASLLGPAVGAAEKEPDRSLRWVVIPLTDDEAEVAVLFFAVLGGLAVSEAVSLTRDSLGLVLVISVGVGGVFTMAGPP